MGRNSSGQSQNGPTRENADILRVIYNMMENQLKQIELLRQRLITAPKEQRPGNVSDFRWLQPAIFTGKERQLDAEQWLIDVIVLLKATHVPEENQVEVAKIQLKNVARTWWLAEEVRLDKPSLGTSSLRAFMIGSSLPHLKRRWKNSLSDSSNGTDLSMITLLNS